MDNDEDFDLDDLEGNVEELEDDVENDFYDYGEGGF